MDCTHCALCSTFPFYCYPQSALLYRWNSIQVSETKTTYKDAKTLYEFMLRLLCNSRLTNYTASLPVYSRSATITYHQHRSWKHALMTAAWAPISPAAVCRHMLLSAPKMESALIGGMLQMDCAVRNIHFQKWMWLHYVWGVFKRTLINISFCRTRVSKRQGVQAMRPHCGANMQWAVSRGNSITLWRFF